MDYEEKLEKWFEEYGDYDYKPELKFETLPDDKKLHPCEQVSAIMFLASKLKPENKSERYFLHGEHDVLYIGSSFDIFEEFTKEDVKTAVSHGIYISEDGSGFQMYASM